MGRENHPGVQTGLAHMRGLSAFLLVATGLGMAVPGLYLAAVVAGGFWGERAGADDVMVFALP